jgi:HSP20 family protein
MSMAEETATPVARSSDILSLNAGDPFFELAQEMNERIALRARELFEARGALHGHDREDWLQAESEFLRTVPVDVLETETELMIRADVPGFNEKNLEVRVTPRSVCILGERDDAAEQKDGNLIYSERRASQIFRVVSLSSDIDPEKVNASLADGVLEIKLRKIGTGKKVVVLGKAATA